MLGWNGARLKRLIKTRGLTQAEFAQKMTEFIKVEGLDKSLGLQPVEQQYVNRWANNKHEPKKYIAVMAKVLDTTTDYLLGIQDNPDFITEDTLSEIEKALISAIRNNQYREIFSILGNSENIV